MVRGQWVMGAIVLSLVPVLGCQAQGAEGLPDSVVRESLHPELLPKGTYTLVREWQTEEPGLGHNTGRLVEDADAVGGKAHEARPGDDTPEMLLFGPYFETEPGACVAFFRLKLLEPLEDDAAGTLDACVRFGQDMLTIQELTATDLVVGRYTQVPLPFHYPGGKLECRLNWSGAAGLRADAVALYRVEGSDLPERLGRVPPAEPSGLPKDLAYYTEPRPYPDLFPRSAPPAKELVVCDLRKERTETRLLVHCLQGLVNRTQPRLYCLSTSTDEFWLDNLEQRGWIEGRSEAKTPEELLRQFRDAYRGVVITDPQLPASKNVATMIASAREGLVASPRLASKLGLPVLDDLRGRWTTSTEAYRWAFDNLWPSLNHHLLACAWPDHLALRDYLVQNRAFIFWLSGPLDGARPYASPTDEARLMEELLARMPVNIPVMSYPFAGRDVGIGEGPGVTLFAEFGKFLVGSIDCTNLSVHSGFRHAGLKQPPAPAAPPLQRDKVHVAIVISDGDNLPVLTLHNFPPLWQDKTRGQTPIGWTLSPSASILLPDVVDYYYRTATPNDYLIGAVSGVGYTYPDVYAKRYRDPDRARIYDGFLDLTAEYMERADLRELWPMNATRPEVIARYAERIPHLNALFPDYGRRVVGPEDATYPTARNVPVFHAVTGWREDATREERIASLVADVKRMTPRERPAFLHLFALNWFTDLPMLQEVLKQLGPEYVAVRPDHLAALWREEMAHRRVLVRLPESAACIEGLPLALRGALRNVTGEPLRAELSLEEGLDRAVLTPQAAALPVAQDVSLKVTGRPVGDRLTLSATGAFGKASSGVTLRRIPQAELAGRLPADLDLSPVAWLEAENLSHRSGALRAEDGAGGGSVWVAEAGQAEPGHIVFGPYAALPEGKHLALFRLRRTGEATGVVAVLDTCVAGSTPQTGLLEVRAEDLPPGQWRWFAVLFDHPGPNYETRVVWSGQGELAVDSIAVWSVTTGDR